VDKTPLYQAITETIRQDILYGVLKPGDELPPVREMARQWQCAPGTIQRAYQELARQGLTLSRPGQGTRVSALSPVEQITPLRRANLVHEAEAFLLHFLSEGYSVPDIEQAVRLALDRWRVMSTEPLLPPSPVLRFIGSHDPALSLLAAQAPGCSFDLSFAGSLSGLIALAEYRTDLAGIHLWDAETDTYNIPFVQRLLPGRRMALLTLAHRRLGLIVPPGNPAHVTGLHDITRPDLRFVNRQRGAGTRVWLDSQLRALQIAPEHIKGYENTVPTHSEVARSIAEEQSELVVGIEATALAYGLDFIFLTKERYDLVILDEIWEWPPVQEIVSWLTTAEVQAAINSLGGYDTQSTGYIEWVN